MGIISSSPAPRTYRNEIEMAARGETKEAEKTLEVPTGFDLEYRDPNNINSHLKVSKIIHYSLSL